MNVGQNTHHEQEQGLVELLEKATDIFTAFFRIQILVD
jgi:hypothetical protein